MQQPKRLDLGEQTSPWKQVASYPYVRADGTVAGEVVRQEAAFQHGRDKQFHQRHWDPQTGRMEAGGFEPIPYQLPDLLEAIGSGRTVYIVEGEKDVAAAESVGLTATTNAGGAMVWNAEHAKWLRGARTVVIVADRDPAGYRRAERVMGTLVGLVERVRVVQAATGKDLHDHLQCGHEIAELEPVPHLDPFTPGRTAVPAPTTTTPAAETPTVSAASSLNPATTPGGNPVTEYLLAPSTDAPVPHSDEVDHVGAQWATFMQLLLNQLLEMARRKAEQRRRDAETIAQWEEDERRAVEQRLEAERAAVETRLRKLRDDGYDKASRTEIAEAVADAVAWAPDSEVARREALDLVVHVRNRFGVDIDMFNSDLPEGAPEVVVAPDLAEAMAAAEQERAAAARLRKAQDRMVEMIAAEEGLEQSAKEELYAAIEAWRANPTARQLDALNRTLADKGVTGPVRTRVRFIAAYLGNPGELVPIDELGKVAAVSATTELRKMATALVDPGEEVKPRVDQLLESYQDALRLGGPTTSLRERLTEAMAVLTPEDEQAVRARGNAIRSNPAGTFPRLWPDHVDREELATTIRVYATLAPQAELAAGKAGALDDATATALTKQADKHRRAIHKAVTQGKGLHEWEKDQIAAVLRDVEAGKTTTPELLFADDRSAAAVDADRSTRIAHDTSHAHRRQLEQILETNHAPQGTVRRTRDAVTRVMDAQTALAAGRASLPDYERTGLDRQLDAKLAAVGVPEPLRHKVRAHLDHAAGEAATAGKQADRIATVWAERMQAVAIERDAAKAQASGADEGYDSPQRREELEKTLRGKGFNDDQVAQHMAADAGFAKPPSAAAARTGTSRRTQQGSGVRRTHHRGKGRGPQLGR